MPRGSDGVGRVKKPLFSYQRLSPILLLVILLLGAETARADVICNGSFTGSLAGNLVVPAGGACTLYQARINGNVQVRQGASLFVDGREEWTSIRGNVDADACTSVFLDGAVTVEGDVQIHGCREPSGFNGPGVEIGGNFLGHDNSGGCKAILGKVGDNARIANNNSSMASDISLDAIGGNLDCQQNAPAPTHATGGSWAGGHLQGQCTARLGFAGAPYACGALAGLSLPDTTISLAQTYGAGEVIIPGRVTAPVALCRVVGNITPSTNPNGDLNINFEVWLPLANWTGRYEQAGNGGSGGSIRYTFDVGSLQAAVANNNAAGATHQGTYAPPGSPPYAYGHPQKINDIGYRAVHRTALMPASSSRRSTPSRRPVRILKAAPTAVARE